MKKHTTNILLSAGLSLAIGASAINTASAIPMELALVIDGSGSMNSNEWNQQINGYISAFNTPGFYSTYIAPSPYDSLWVSAFQFSSSVMQEIEWTHITDDTSAAIFASQFTFSQQQGLTNTQAAILSAADSILSNGITSAKMAIDISTDGQPTTCLYPCSNAQAAAYAAADYARANGITVNALGIGDNINHSFLNNLVSPDGFFLTAEFGNFGTTLTEKLGKEINGVPEPSSLFLLGIGLLGFVFTARRRKL